MGFNRNVVRHTTGVRKTTDHLKSSPGSMLSAYYSKQAVTENHNMIDKSLVEQSKKDKINDFANKTTKHLITESQILSLSNRLGREGKAILFKDILFEAFYRCLYIDDDFKAEKEDHIRAVVEGYVDMNGGYAMLENAIKRSKIPFLKNVKALCEATSNKVARRKVTEAKDGDVDIPDIKFELNDDEKDEFDYEKGKLGIDQLANLVKKKVLTVVKDDKKRQQQETELYSEIENEAQEQGENVQEAAKRILFGKSPIEESTLFTAFARQSYQELLEESTVHQNNARFRDRYKNTGDFVDTTPEDMRQDQFEDEEQVNDEATGKYDKNRKAGETADDDDDLIDDEDLSISMDLVLAESITKYTLYEMAYTICLEDFKPADVKKIVHGILN